MPEDETEITCQVGECHTASAGSGLRRSDPRLAIPRPLPVSDISEKDRAWRLLGAAGPDIRARMSVAPVVMAG